MQRYVSFRSAVSKGGLPHSSVYLWDRGKRSGVKWRVCPTLPPTCLPLSWDSHDTAQRPHICLGAMALSQQHFWSHIVGGATDGPERGQGGGEGSAPALQSPYPCPRCESRQSSCLSPKARELLLVLGQWMLGIAAESLPTRLAQLLSCSAGQGEPLTLLQGQHRGPITDSSSPCCRLSGTHTGCHLPRSVLHTHQHQLSHSPISTHLPHVICVMHTQSSWPYQGLLIYLPGVTFCHSHTLSLSLPHTQIHTLPVAPSPCPLTGSVRHLQEPLHLHLSQEVRVIYPICVTHP